MRILLFLSPGDTDSLVGMVPSACQIVTAATFEEVEKLIAENSIEIIICDASVDRDETWKKVLELIKTKSNPSKTKLIVCAYLHDVRLWKELIHLGGFDILLKPFVVEEVNQTLRLAASSAHGCA